MPGRKQRTVRRKKIRPPHKRVPQKLTKKSSSTPTVATRSQQTLSSTPTRTTSTSHPQSPLQSPSTSTQTVSASRKKLSKSPHTPLSTVSSDSDDEMIEAGNKLVVLEIDGVNEALKSSVACKECSGGPIVFVEDHTSKKGLCTKPSLHCEQCGAMTPISFSTLPPSNKALTVNRKSVFANKCIGGTWTSLNTFCTMMDLPLPVSQKRYREHSSVINEQCVAEAQGSMQRAREEVFKCYDALPGDIVDVTVSSDGTWQRRGYSSLLGVTFVIEHKTKKVLDYEVMSKFCAACKKWEDCDRESEEFKKWQEEHKSVCEANFTGSAGAMEPTGVLSMFSRSLSFNIRYKHLICDGDAKTHSLLLEESPYGEEHPVQKVDCVGHVQKRMGTALRDLKKKYRGQKLSDGKTIGGAGRLTESVINSLQNYYGEAIRRHTGDLPGMMKAVQASLLHYNSTDEQPRHHLCPEGENSWCKWQKSKAKGIEYTHKRPPLPSAIVKLLQPIYSRLGSKTLLERCLAGYTQNPNESLHSTVWKLCPKELFLGRMAVEIACALAVCRFNDGATSLYDISKRLDLDPSYLCKLSLQQKDLQRIEKADYKSSEHYKKLRRRARAKRKGFEDKNLETEGEMYSSGAFDIPDLQPGPSKRQKK